MQPQGGESSLQGQAGGQSSTAGTIQEWQPRPREPRVALQLNQSQVLSVGNSRAGGLRGGDGRSLAGNSRRDIVYSPQKLTVSSMGRMNQSSFSPACPVYPLVTWVGWIYKGTQGSLSPEGLSWRSRSQRWGKSLALRREPGPLESTSFPRLFLRPLPPRPAIPSTLWTQVSPDPLPHLCHSIQNRSQKAVPLSPCAFWTSRLSGAGTGVRQARSLEHTFKEALHLRCTQVQAWHLRESAFFHNIPCLPPLPHPSPSPEPSPPRACVRSPGVAAMSILRVSRSILKATACSALTGHIGKRRATQIPTWAGTPSVGPLWFLQK